jgi:serine/threonine-protein kinase
MTVVPGSERSAARSFGKYQLIATLGQGGMANVFLAVAQGPAGFNKLQVIKRLRRQEFGEGEDIVTMFLDEARLAARLNHPNVVQTNEVGEVDGEYFLAMEYLDGQPLNRVMHRVRSARSYRDRAQGALTSGEGVLLRAVADALAGLHYAHELADYDGAPLHVVHRDASPHNIFVTYEGHTKVVDFGIAKAATRSTETSAGVLKGKIAYMAPEQVRCKPLDRRADVFVIGIVIWEILAGQKMWKGRADMEIVNLILSREIPRLEEARPDVPPELALICARALAYEPEDRYPTAAALRADLLEYLERVGLRTSAEEIGHLVGALFADKRAELKAVIERQLSGLRAGGPGPSPVDLSSHGPPSTQSSPSGATSQLPLPNLAVPSSSDSGFSRPAPPPQARRLLFSAAIGAAAAVAVGVLVLRARAPEAPPPTASAPPESATAPPVTPAPQPAPEPAPAPSTIELRIGAAPPSAKLFLDDVPLENNPFAGRFPADGARHLVRVEAPGYATQKEFASFDEDITLDFDLDRKTAVVSRPRRKAPPPPEPAAAPSADPSGDAEPAALSAGAQAKPKRKLSGSDPWGTSPGAPAPSDTTGKPKRKLSGSDPWSQ